ncbi:MAG: rhomboid family intramembrane serine protease, partial [Actinobacteria bacterium]|nr:rhomboid family intramembrane serine protease [Actinomycetota bacterium]
MAAALEQHRRATDDLDAATRALSASLDQVGLADLERIDGVERQVLTLAVALGSGVGVWLTGASASVHVGASGVIFGWLGFLLLAGLVERR